ncbi:hypothetical protein [Pantoea ananatis]|uniref:hypothetical protein n=1 Tax=Pantoea ananas TaxID=553 RepID=UPI001B3041C3|nr:hypothetical protein [Pantoea ananatis]
MIKRYEVVGDKYGDGTVKESETGQVVFYEDYAALQQKLDAMAAENGYLKDSVAMHAAGFSECSVCGHEEPCETHDIVWMAKETPATDAYLNSVRAEGLKMAIDHMNNQTSDDCADVTVLPVKEMYKKLISGTHDTADKEGAK